MNIRDTHHLEPERPLVLGVTGGVGSGKSLVLGRLRELGAAVQSADLLARRAVEPGTNAYEQIVKYFGNRVLAPDGSIDRAGLRRIVIRDDNARKALESFVHPEVLRQMTEYIKEAGKQGARVAAVEVPLLFETGLRSFFNYVLMVTAKRETRIRRIMERDGATRDDAEALMKAQMPEDEKCRLADFVIENNGNIPELLAEVERIYRCVKP
ncbi:MAG: dephospho-CoA kinase [Desulfobacteraceae bacterium]|nr:dephospho-CoA kinase [Desulfobacteraceae bacterium]